MTEIEVVLILMINLKQYHFPLTIVGNCTMIYVTFEQAIFEKKV